MKRIMIVCIAAVLIAGVLMGHTMFTSMAKEENHAEAYYKSIQIKEGENLWKIAELYKAGCSMSTHEYVDCLMQMNGLKNDKIHAGQYLTVVYYQ